MKQETYLHIFERTEKKYIVSSEQRAALWSRIADRMQPDEHYRSTVCSLYLDTEDRRVIRASMEKPLYKEKVRLRSYGVPGEEDTVFLEIKKKFKGVVYKRRESMLLREARAYLNGGKAPRDSQILREIDWTIRKGGFLRPAAYIAYQREAYRGIAEKDLRITFDSSIVYRDTALALEEGVWGQPILEEGRFIMELKALNAMPLWLADALDACGIRPASFSKYGTAYEKSIA